MNNVKFKIKLIEPYWSSIWDKLDYSVYWKIMDGAGHTRRCVNEIWGELALWRRRRRNSVL